MVTEQHIEQFKQELLELKQELQQSIELAQDSAETVELDQTKTGRVSRGDALQQQEMAKAGLARDKQRFLNVIKALNRIEDDDYGFCMECGEPITVSRLEIMPEAEFCIQCMEKQER
ncbi:TraR/DksA family transcriptional regulator [Pleionea sediminis]|uniref:TraR/DksA family transcriptional regulator n=1 Tax=Pleionea sediminis TaxID=2569479 RepID=UPI00118649EF|nr:TraR/DksA family transcriptional regulator [Pleionea sediminis]